MRIYVVDSLLSIGQTLALPKEASQHVLKVCRSRVGDAITLFNGRGGEYHAHLSAIEKQTAMVEIEAFNSIERENTLNIHLFHGIARGEKMDWIIQKATELGVTRFTPIKTQKCVVKLDEERAEKKHRHWQQIIIHSSEQCGRNTLMQLEEPISYSQAIAQPFEGKTLLCEPSWPNELLMNKTAPIRLFIGGESGFSEEELKQAQRQSAKSLSLGPRILRTETAAIVAMTILTHT